MEFKLPDLGEGVVSGEIVKWLVQVGDEVKVDQALVEIMTDKATIELPCPSAGKVRQILTPEGTIAKVGQTLAHIGDSASDTSLPEPTKSKQSQPLTTPALRALAKERGIDLNSVTASGPGGRITEADLDLANKPTSHKTPMLREGNETIVPLRGLRRLIAEHMSLSRKTAAHFTHVDEVDLTALMALRLSADRSAEKKGVKPSILAYFVQAVVKALKLFPILNASLDDDKQEILIKKHFHIGIATATDSGLMVPVLKNADRLSLFEIAAEIARLAESARKGDIAREDLTGGTFTLTNIGSIGGLLSAPIINYPEVAIMGLHKIQERPVVRDGKIVIRQMMNISVSGDHRVVDGAEVAQFCNTVIADLENPT